MGTFHKRHADVGARNGSRKSRPGGRPSAAEAERVALIGPGECDALQQPRRPLQGTSGRSTVIIAAPEQHPFKRAVECTIPALLPARGTRHVNRSAAQGAAPARQQEQGSARASAVMVRPAGAVPSRSADTIRGERKASGASSWICRFTFASRRAIAAKLATRPCAKSSIHSRAFAIAIRRASRRPGRIGVLCAGTWTMPLTAAGTGFRQGTAIVFTPAIGHPDEVLLAAS
jgi:hypothetical protein